MIRSLISAARRAGVDTRALYQRLSRWSLDEAAREQRLETTVTRLREIVPDLRDQYTLAMDETEYRRYWEVKMRAAHAWQIQCVMDALAVMPGSQLSIADIGDSSGTHAAYIRALAPEGKVKRILSVNLDPAAVERVRAKGGDAIQSRAEDLRANQIDVDLVLSFETLEHLTDPVRFLHKLARESVAEHILITVPLRRQSRFGGAQMRLPENELPARMTAEEVHMYEFSPDDWALLVRFAGFQPIFTRRYYQYGRRSLSRLLAPLWRRLDFDGFLAVFARRDLSLADRYADW